MRKEEVKFEDKVFVVRELLAREVDEIDFKDTKGALKKQLLLATGMSEVDYNELTFNERLILQKKLNELNGVGVVNSDFSIQTLTKTSTTT